MSKRMSDEDLEVYRAYALYDGLTLEAGRVVMAETIRARAAEARLRDALESIKAALGDRLLAEGPLSKEYAHAVMTEIQEALR